MNDNTILRIKVPAHLYESVKKQLTLTEAQKGGKAYGDWTVVKEKKAPKDGMKKVEEEKVETTEKKSHSLDELKKAKAALDKKIEEMEVSKVDEAAPGVEFAWIPGAIGAGFIAKAVVDATLAKMKEKNLTGIKGFWQAYKETGKRGSSAIDRSMGGNMEEAKEEEKKEEDK
jgi:hypothetical protein